MSYKIEKKDGIAEVDFTIAWSDVEADFEEAVKKASEGVEMKGFRKGKAPEEARAAQVDRAHVLSDVADAALRKEYTEAVTKEELQIAAAPEVNVKKLAEGNDIEISMKATLVPEVKLPSDWKKVIATVNKEQKPAEVKITDEEIDAELERLAQQRTEDKVVERAAADGDQVKIDFTVKQDGVIIEGGTSTDHALILGSNSFIPGFEEEIIGLNKGDEKSFELNFPEEYHAEHLAGKPATFEIVLKEVAERVVPEINDDFAKSAGKDIDSLDTLKKNISEGMVKEREAQAQEAGRTAILEALVEKIDIDLPDAMVGQETERMLGEMEQQIQMSGMTLDDYLGKMGKSREEMQEEWKPQGVKRIVSALALEQLGKELATEPTKEEIEAEMNKTMEMYKGMPDMENQIDMAQLYSYTAGILRNGKVFEELAKIS